LLNEIEQKTFQIENQTKCKLRPQMFREIKPNTPQNLFNLFLTN